VRPVQLIPEADARPGNVARHVPSYEPVACNGCAFIQSCRDRGASQVFIVREVRGQPVYCQKIDGPMVACRADHLPELEPREVRPQEPAPLWLCDSNVFINAERWNWRQCRLVVERAGARYRLATTRQARAELAYAYRMPPELEVLDVDESRLHPRLLEVARANRGADPHDAASLTDLGLVQALLDHPQIVGLISEDDDLRRLHVPSLVREIAGRETHFMTSAEFCRSKPAVFPDYGA